MKKLFLVVTFFVLSHVAFAQQAVLLCTSTPGGTTSCTPVTTANPLPVTSN